MDDEDEDALDFPCSDDVKCCPDCNCKEEAKSIRHLKETAPEPWAHKMLIFQGNNCMQ